MPLLIAAALMFGSMSACYARVRPDPYYSSGYVGRGYRAPDRYYYPRERHHHYRAPERRHHHHQREHHHRRHHDRRW